MLKRRRKKRRKNEKVQEIRQTGTVCGGEGYRMAPALPGTKG